jgi:hypothetical protein
MISADHVLTVKTCVVIAQKRIEKWKSYADNILMHKSE